MDTTKYQSDKVAALQSAISSGNSVLANKDSTQEQIDAATAAINTAVQNCISSPVQTTPPPDTGGDANNGNGTTPSRTTPRTTRIIKHRHHRAGQDRFMIRLLFFTFIKVNFSNNIARKSRNKKEICI